MVNEGRYREAFQRWMRVGWDRLSARDREVLFTGRAHTGYRVPNDFRRQLIEAMERHRE